LAGCGSGGCGSGGCKTKMSNNQSLLTVEEVQSLQASIDNGGCGSMRGEVKFVDASWHMDKSRSGFKEFLRCRIANAQYFDIDEISDKSSTLPHMLPSEELFQEAVANLGISSRDHVVVYTVADSFSAARVWWTFRLFGHEKVSILQGGLTSWIDANGEIESGPTKPVSKGEFRAVLNKKMVVSANDVLNVVNTGSSQILDARSSPRFLAQTPEPRPGLPSGHIPGSLNLPFTELVKTGDFSTFKTPAEIRDAIVNSGVILGSNVILSCGSGVSAAVLGFGMHLIGKDLDSFPIYDGSWSEWGSRNDLPKITAEDLVTK
jgi:thiosulfate/3-mercaptopyruvate sulfurtransferase